MARRALSTRNPEPAHHGVVELQPASATLPAATLVRYAVYGVVLVLVGALGGWLVAGLGTTVHGARAEILYQLDGEQPTGFLRQDRQLSTQLVALRSRGVLQPVAEDNGLRFEELADRLQASVVESSEVLRIEVHDRSGRRAQALAAGVAERYLERFRPEGTAEARGYLEQQLDDIDARQERVRARLEELEQQRLGAARSGNEPPSSAEEIRLQAEAQSLLDERDQLRERLDEVTVDDLRSPTVELITNAYVLDDPVAPRPERAAAAGAAAGLLAAVAAVALLIRRRSGEPRRR